MSIPTIITEGFGNGALSGSIKDVITQGFSIGASTAPTRTEVTTDKVKNGYLR